MPKENGVICPRSLNSYVNPIVMRAQDLTLKLGLLFLPYSCLELCPPLLSSLPPWRED
jgi:hypothetical protein